MSKEKKSKKKIKVWMIVVAIVGVLLVVGVVSMVMEGKKAMEAMEDMAMDSDDIYTVEKQDLKSEITTSGTVVGIDQIAYTSPVTAKVEDIKVEVGQTVHEGEMLLTYDASDLGDDLAKVELQAKSEKAAGSASYEAANKAAGKASDAKTKASSLEGDISAIQARMTELNTIISTYELEHPDNSQAGNGSAGNENTDENAENSGTNVPTTETVDYATYQSATVELESLTGDLADKQAELSEQQAIIEAADDAKVTGSAATQISVANQLADMNVSDAQKTLDAAEAGITAKKKGIVTSVDIIKGAYAAEAQTLMTIVNADDIGVEFVISKDDLGIVKEGQKARVVVAGKEYEGTVSYVSRVATMDNAITSTTATVKGKIALDNPDDDIFIGVSAKVYLFIGEKSDALAVPYQALNSDVDGDYVYTVNEENIIERKDVTIGLITDEYYEITEGLKAGDRVITNVTKDMKPGDEYVPEINPMVVQ
ncbi:MAG: efflux RND transporter periplasmic adaptor subunit [Lachnospiraceae bacterium]